MLSQNEIKARFFDYVTRRPGSTPIEIAVNASVIHDDNALAIPELIERWVDGKELVEVEYVLPTMTYKTKFLYYPQGSKITVNSTAEVVEIFCNDERHKVFPPKTEVNVRGQ